MTVATTLTIVAIVGLAICCGVFAAGIARYAVMFVRELLGTRRLSTLAGAATVIAILVNLLVGTFSQPLPALTPPPKAKAPAHPAGEVAAPHP